jgi:hypothetical protein
MVPIAAGRSPGRRIFNRGFHPGLALSTSVASLSLPFG